MLPCFFILHFEEKRNKQKHHLFCLRVWNQQTAYSLVETICNFGIFQVPTFIAYIHIVHKENRGMLQLCRFLLFFSVSLFCQKIFSWEMKFFLLLLNALQLSTFYVNSSHMNSHKMENGNKKCQRTESQKRCNLENYVHVWVCLLT